MSLPPPSRFKKLRTKTGCVNCRDRRKKCDERKPKCADCARLGFECHWSDPASSGDRRERGTANSRWSAISKIPGSGYPSSENSISSVETASAKRACSWKEEYRFSPISLTVADSYFEILSSARIFLRTDRELFLSTCYFENFLPANILPSAHANFSRFYLGDIPELNDSMFACSSMQLANRNKYPPIEALCYYTRALSGLRRQLHAQQLKGSEVWLLAVTILLHCFETWCYSAGDSTPGQTHHLLGAVQLLKLCYKNSETELHHEFCTLMAESVIFHVSTLITSESSLAIFHTNSDLWELVETIFQRHAYDNILSPINHPVLGTPWKLNKLVFEISTLSIRIPLMIADMREKVRLEIELLKWEEVQEKNWSDTDSFKAEDPYINARHLYILCARILLLSIHTNDETFDVPHFKSQVRRHRSRAIHILHGMLNESKGAWNFVMRWPLSILGHLVEEMFEREVVREALGRIWLNSSCGDVKRSLDEIKSRENRDSVDSDRSRSFPPFVLWSSILSGEVGNIYSRP